MLTEILHFAESVTLVVGENRISGKVPSELGSIETLGTFFDFFCSSQFLQVARALEYLDLWNLDVEPWSFQPWLFRLTNLGKAVSMERRIEC